MKKNIILLGTIVFLLFMWGCRKEDSSAGLSVESDNMEIPFSGGVFTIPVTSNMPSKAVISYGNPSQSEWIFMLPSVLRGNGLLELRIEPYTSIWEDRTATITITAGEESKTVVITQLAKATLTINPEIITTTESAKTFTVTVESKADWTAHVNEEASSWCTLTGNSGSGIGSFIVNLSDLSSGVHRKATITVVTPDFSEEISVQQGLGVEVDGIIWAHYNVGSPNSFVTSIDGRGLLYQYDSKIGYPNSSPNVDNTAPPGYVTGQFSSGPTWSPTNDPSPAGWRIPTESEINALMNKGFTWVTPEQSGLTIPGVIIGIPSSEAMLATKDNTRGGIFLPQTGYRNRDDGKQENWWDATITSITRPGHNWDRPVFWFNFESNGGSYTAGNAAAYPVRCVMNNN